MSETNWIRLGVAIGCSGLNLIWLCVCCVSCPACFGAGLLTAIVVWVLYRLGQDLVRAEGRDVVFLQRGRTVRRRVASSKLDWQSPAVPTVARPAAPAVTIQPRARTLWERRHWRRHGQRLIGAFRTRLGSRSGEIVLRDENPPQFYILHPPRALLRGPHGACFRWRGNGRYFIHFSASQPDPDAGIAAVEHLLLEALQQEAA